MKRRIKITEKQAKAIAAQDQVGNKVNSGLMHYEGGICEDADFELGPEDGAISPYYHVTNGSASVNENAVNEISPEEVDLSSFRIKKELNPKFWSGDRLNPGIRKRLIEIASDFCDFSEISVEEADDIILTGSICNYNWSEGYSDIDLHILYDFGNLDMDAKRAKKYFDAVKNEWNESHDDITIYGFNVELYVQDSNEEHTSSGIYSLLDDEWKMTPDREKLASGRVNKKFIRNSVSVYTEKIDKLDKILKNKNNSRDRFKRIYDISDKIISDLKDTRKKSLDSTGNEISDGNIIYKSLRRMGYIDKIYAMRDYCYDKINSLP